MSTDGTKALVRRFVEELWGHGNLAVADDLLTAEDAAVYKGWATRLRAGMPDLSATVDHLIAEDDLAAVFWTWRGTHTGVVTGPFVDLLVPSGRIEPTGNAVTITGCFLFQVTGGTLTRLRLSGDNFGLFQQLGVLPSTRAPGR